MRNLVGRGVEAKLILSHRIPMGQPEQRGKKRTMPVKGGPWLGETTVNLLGSRGEKMVRKATSARNPRSQRNVHHT